jgi:hypothetical protein
LLLSDALVALVALLVELLVELLVVLFALVALLVPPKEKVGNKSILAAPMTTSTAVKI